jgi:hypothetical protein
MTELLIRVDSNSQCPRLAGFLRRCHAQPRMLDEHSLAIELDDDGCPGLATLVPAIEEWWGSGEVSLTLGDEVRVLRTET